ncbi:MAG TPA: laccase domain-containing protein, partial [Gemmataceae bacterium]|nr:laccase domain-containing protein [Gemmataceae bacterium]
MSSTKPLKQKRRAPKANAKRSPSKFAASRNWLERELSGVRVVQAASLARIPWLVHGFSTRPGGASELNGQRVLNLSVTDWDARENVVENRTRFVAALVGANALVAKNGLAREMQLVALKQIHSDVVHAFAAPPKEACQGDASITHQQGLLLGVQTADCVPILLVDPKRRAVAAVHAGWRGTLARVVAKTVGQIQ